MTRTASSLSRRRKTLALVGVASLAFLGPAAAAFAQPNDSRVPPGAPAPIQESARQGAPTPILPGVEPESLLEDDTGSDTGQRVDLDLDSQGRQSTEIELSHPDGTSEIIEVPIESRLVIAEDGSTYEEMQIVETPQLEAAIAAQEFAITSDETAKTAEDGG